MIIAVEVVFVIPVAAHNLEHLLQFRFALFEPRQKQSFEPTLLLKTYAATQHDLQPLLLLRGKLSPWHGRCVAIKCEFWKHRSLLRRVNYALVHALPQ